MEKVKEFVDYLKEGLDFAQDKLNKDSSVTRNVNTTANDYFSVIRDSVDSAYTNFLKMQDNNSSDEQEQSTESMTKEEFKDEFKKVTLFKSLGEICGPITFYKDINTDTLFVYTNNVLETHKILKDNEDAVKSFCPNTKRIVVVYGITTVLDEE